jgi:hypothetical protein
MKEAKFGLLKITDGDLLFWADHHDKLRKEGVPAAFYCRINGLDNKTFHNKGIPIQNMKYSNPKEYKRVKSINEEFEASGKPFGEFFIGKKELKAKIGCFRTHLLYVERLKILREERKNGKVFSRHTDCLASNKEINFVQIPTKVPMNTSLEPNISVQAEVIEPKNDIELNIAKGVRVFVSPNIDSLKIIKIIELLKDL